MQFLNAVSKSKLVVSAIGVENVCSPYYVIFRLLFEGNLHSSEYWPPQLLVIVPLFAIFFSELFSMVQTRILKKTPF